MNNKISNRESQVLKLISREYTTYEIAQVLHVSHNTVKSHKKNLFSKMNVKNIAGLVRRGFETGLLTIT